MGLSTLELSLLSAAGPAPPPITPQAAAAAYYAAMTVQPDSSRKDLILALISAGMANGWWSKLDWLCLLASHDAQAALVNLAAPQKAAIAFTNPIFTVDRGYSGNGTSDWLSVGASWATTSSRFSQDSATLGAWCNAQLGAAGIQPHIGHNSSTTARLRARDTAGTEDFCVNDANVNTFRNTSGARVGHRTVVRTSATEKRGYFNGQLVSNLTIPSTAPSTTTGSVLRGGSSYTSDQIAAFYAGAALSGPQVASLHDDLFAYLSAIGAA